MEGGRLLDSRQEQQAEGGFRWGERLVRREGQLLSRPEKGTPPLPGQISGRAG